MKLRIVLLVIYILRTVTARDIEIESFKGTADTDPTFMSFGTTRVTKKGRNSFVVSGDLEFLKNFGNEYNIKTEIFTSDNKLLVKQMKPACDFMKDDKMTWPQLVSKSNMPKDVCPFPKGKYSVTDFIMESSQIPLGVLPGAYLARLTILEGNKPVAGYEMRLVIKM